MTGSKGPAGDLVGEGRRGGRRRPQVAVPGGRRAAARRQIVAAVLAPEEADRGRQIHRLDLLAVAEGVPLALDDQGGAAQPGERLEAELVGLPGRVERIAETDDPDDAPVEGGIAGEHRRDAPAHGLAADQHRPVVLDERFRQRGGVFADEPLRGGRRPLLSAAAAPGHVGEFEADDVEPGGRGVADEALHERRVHRGARAVGEDQRRPPLSVRLCLQKLDHAASPAALASHTRRLPPTQRSRIGSAGGGWGANGCNSWLNATGGHGIVRAG